ncbi:hypothetical protein RDWZM_003934 [Blomia tropicalis]|uniref:Translation initiation factor eIF2B subunit beta n=1 Tax=Blomia tropicalis TaxID=40697 RepID=A0A9Q0MGI7_BLOTA|nr:hypothetical protein RDWZM_003934 [Blomia tropicalis]
MDSESNNKLEKLIDFIKFRKSTTGSYDLAKRTATFINDLIQGSDDNLNVQELIENITIIGRKLVKIDPTETVVGNMIKRVLKLVRDEYNHIKGENDETQNAHESLEIIVTAASNEIEEFDPKIKIKLIKDPICIAINELLSELEISGGNIAQQALEHIYSDEVIMTIGSSKTVEAFLKYASKNKRKFQTIIAECAPFYNGHDLALSLANDSINTILIPDSAIFSVMSRVNKVIIGAHSIMANGGIKAVSGAYTLALAAKHYSVPFIVCTGMFKLTPQNMVNYDQLAFNKFSSPQDILKYETDYSTKCQVINPVFDYVPPELVTIFVSNIGGNSPSHVYHLLNELYHQHDELD